MILIQYILTFFTDKVKNKKEKADDIFVHLDPSYLSLDSIQCAFFQAADLRL